MPSVVLRFRPSRMFRATRNDFFQIFKKTKEKISFIKFVLKIDYFSNRDSYLLGRGHTTVRLLWEWEIIERSERTFFRISVRQTAFNNCWARNTETYTSLIGYFSNSPGRGVLWLVVGILLWAASRWVMIPLLLLMLNNKSTANENVMKTIWLKFCSKFLTFLLVKPQKDSLKMIQHGENKKNEVY